MERGESSSTRGGKRITIKPKATQKEKNEIEERRRERARESQRNFHLRRQAKFGILEQRITSLEETIEQMSNEFIDFGDRVVTKAGPATKSLILDDLRTATERFLDLARAAESPSDQDEPSSESSLTKKSRIGTPSANQNMPTALGLGPFDPFEFDGLFAAATPSLMSYAVKQVDPHIRSPNYSQYPGQFSPRLDYGFFGTGSSFFQRTPTPETPWLTYVISGPGSFAKRLYVDTTVLLFNVLRGAQSIPGFIPTILRFRARHERPQTLMGKLRYQFGKMHIDANNAESLILNADERGSDELNKSLILFGPSDYEMLDQLLLKVVRDYSQELGGRLDEWLDPWATQQYLSQDWGLQFSSQKVKTSEHTIRNLEVPIEDFSFQPPEADVHEIRWWNTSSSSTPSYVKQPVTSVSSNPASPQIPKKEVEISPQQLARKLTFRAMCFGEGPRYPKSGIDQVVRELLGEAFVPLTLSSPITTA